jgi:hypothetical protein
MADKYDYANILLDALLTSAYASVSGRSKEPYPESFDDTTARAGLEVIFSIDDVLILDVASGECVASILFASDRDAVTIYIEPAALLFKALKRLEQPITITEM